MREILFRGKTKTGFWIEGFLFQTECDGVKEWCISMSPLSANDYSEILGDYGEVIPETVGQYTGLTDKNGKKIFEGDIVLFPWGEKREVFSVEFVEGEFEAIPKRKSTDIWCIRIGSYAPEFEVIGNIHDNPELLKGGGEG